MKTIKFSTSVAALAVLLANASCMDNDVYDPEKIRKIDPVENPFDFSAPADFDWNMLQNVSLNIQVKDYEDYNGTSSLIEVFSVDPLHNAEAPALAAGTAKGGETYHTLVTLSKNAKLVYIRLTDPRQRQEVFQFQVSANMTCPLYITPAADTRSAMGTTRAEEPAVEIPSYPQPEVPAELTSIEKKSWTQLKGGESYLIDTDLAGSTLNGVSDKECTIYVKGNHSVGTITDGIFNIVVLEGASLTVGKMSAIDENSSIKNYGTLTISEGAWIDTAVLIYNEGTIKSGVITAGVNSQIINKGELNVDGDFEVNTNGTVYNDKNATLNVGKKFGLTTSTIHNYGKITATNQEEWNCVTTNNKLEVVINNYEGATLDATTIKGGCTVNNWGTLIAGKYDAYQNAPSVLNNNCAVIIKESITVGNIVLDNGSISGPQVDGVWTPVPSVTTNSEAVVTLKNNSVIIADRLNLGVPCTISGVGEKVSVIIANSTKYTGDATIENLALALGTVDKPEYASEPKGCSQATTTPKYDVESCTVVVEGNEGGSITDPILPDISTVDKTNRLTYAFEDNWPVYGDFDMNDVVISLDKITVTGENNQATDNRLNIEGRIHAVGATKGLGVGIRLLNTAISDISSKVENTTDLEEGQTNPVFIITDDVHKYFEVDEHIFLNTLPDGKTKSAQTFKVALELNTLEAAQRAAQIGNIDIFIFYATNAHSGNRAEVHIPGFTPTDKADPSFFGSGNDASKERGYYLSKDGLSWAICVPSGSGVWQWPAEYTSITSAYPSFAPWIKSNGTENIGWYQDPESDKVYAKKQ